MTGFGIPGESTGSGSGDTFLGRIQFDASTGFWKIVKREQNSDGSWSDVRSDLFKNPTLLMDFGSIEGGYINFASPPEFRLVPFGQPYPPIPTETKINQDGKTVPAFQPGFRIKVANSKLFGDNEPYHFSSVALNVYKPMAQFLDAVMADPQAAEGKVPLVDITTLEVPSTRRSFYQPVFKIKSWHARPALFGERTVPPPDSPVGITQSGNGASRPAAAAATTRQAAQPARQSVQQRAAQLPQQPVGGGIGAGMSDQDIEDAIPFAPCWQ